MSNKHKQDLQKKQRTYLKDILPLDIPLSINIEATSACNLQCKYCIHSLKTESQYDMGLMPYEFMSEDVFDKFISGMKEFGKSVKSIRFAGFGEPLLHSKLAWMIEKIKKENIADKIVIFTNASALTPDKIVELIEAGVDSFQIDIQGLCAEDYKNNCNRNVNFDEIYKNVKFLWENKRDSEVYIRTLRFEVEGRQDKYYEMFKDYADYIAIDNTCSISDEIDYSDMINADDLKTDENNILSRYCPQPFFQLTVNADGGIAACCGAISRKCNPLIIGNVLEDSVKNIWNCNKMNEIRKQILKDKYAFESCKSCHIKDILSKYDVLDDVVEELYNKY